MFHYSSVLVSASPKMNILTMLPLKARTVSRQVSRFQLLWILTSERLLHRIVAGKNLIFGFFTQFQLIVRRKKKKWSGKAEIHLFSACLMAFSF